MSQNDSSAASDSNVARAIILSGCGGTEYLSVTPDLVFQDILYRYCVQNSLDPDDFKLLRKTDSQTLDPLSTIEECNILHHEEISIVRVWPEDSQQLLEMDLKEEQVFHGYVPENFSAGYIVANARSNKALVFFEFGTPFCLRVLNPNEALLVTNRQFGKAIRADFWIFDTDYSPPIYQTVGALGPLAAFISVLPVAIQDVLTSITQALPPLGILSRVLNSIVNLGNTFKENRSSHFGKNHSMPNLVRPKNTQVIFVAGSAAYPASKIADANRFIEKQSKNFTFIYDPKWNVDSPLSIKDTPPSSVSLGEKFIQVKLSKFRMMGSLVNSIPSAISKIKPGSRIRFEIALQNRFNLQWVDFEKRQYTDWVNVENFTLTDFEQTLYFDTPYSRVQSGKFRILFVAMFDGNSGKRANRLSRGHRKLTKLKEKPKSRCAVLIHPFKRGLLSKRVILHYEVAAVESN